MLPLRKLKEYSKDVLGYDEKGFEGILEPYMIVSENVI